MKTPNTTALENKLIALWLRHDNAWMSSGELIKLVPEETVHQHVYAATSRLASLDILDRKKTEKIRGHQYRVMDPELWRAAPLKDIPIPVVVKEGEKGRKTSVVWNAEEQYRLAEAMVGFRDQQPHAKFLTLFNFAQAKMLPPERRRHINDLGKIPWIDERMQQVRDEIAAHGEQKIRDDIAESILPAEKSAAEVQADQVANDIKDHGYSDFVARGSKPLPVSAAPSTEPEPLLVGIAKYSAGSLIDELFHRFASTVKRGILGIIASPEMNALVNPEPRIETTTEPFTGMAPAHVFIRDDVQEMPKKHNPEPVANGTEKPRLKKVLIVGILKPLHNQEIEKEFKDVYDIKIYHPDQNVSLLKSAAVGADETIVLTDKVSHKHIQALEAAGVKNWRRCVGGVSRLKEFITNMYANS